MLPCLDLLDPSLHSKYLAPSPYSDVNGVLKAPTVTVHLRDDETCL